MLNVQEFDRKAFSARLTELQGGLSDRSFARKVGISATSLNNYLSGQTPGIDKVISMAAACGVNVAWLATGEGPKLATQGITQKEDVAEIPRLDVLASAGPGASGAAEKAVEMVPFPRAFLRSIGVSPLVANIVTVTGDSMEPTLSAGDELIVDTSVKRIKAEALYVLVLDGEVLVKRAQRRMNGSVLITSDNDRYPPEEITAEAARDLHVAGRVVWYGHRM